MQDVTTQLADRLTTTIETGSKKQWLFACKKNDGFIASIMDTSRLSKARLNKMQDRNLDALQAFQGRKVEGMNLSERVWKYVGQYREQMETALDAGLGEGRSAQQLARDVKQNLKDPNRLFRRVRDKRGNLVLSKAARAFHPGRGVYRSSVKNAQRLTRSEINMAYRESDWQRWQSLDFVVGYEVVRSNHEPLCDCDICARLVGRYPKTFKFIGWHPQCMCYAIPILMDEETFDDNELGDLKAALRGTTYKHKQAANTVTDVPDSFKEWVKDHIEAQKKWASTPYFIRDNFKNGDLSKGLKIALPIVEPDVPQTLPEIITHAKKVMKETEKTLAKSRAMNQGVAMPLAPEIKYRRTQIRNEAKKTLSGTTMSVQGFGKPISISTRAIKEWLNQPFANPEAKNECLLYLPMLMNNAAYMGCGVDKHDARIKAHLFQIKISGITCWVIVREMMNGECVIHSLTDNSSIFEKLGIKKP